MHMCSGPPDWPVAPAACGGAGALKGRVDEPMPPKQLASTLAMSSNWLQRLTACW